MTSEKPMLSATTQRRLLTLFACLALFELFNACVGQSAIEHRLGQENYAVSTSGGTSGEDAGFAVSDSGTTVCEGGAACNVCGPCEGGVCAGTCKATHICRAAVCDSSSGDCLEAPEPAGTSCAAEDTCKPDGICDSTGACIGQAAPDGTHCTGLCGNGACISGICTCTTPPTGGGSDSGTGGTTKPRSGGCDMIQPEAGGDLRAAILCALGLAGLAWLRRRRARS
jgi:hypothetical protein